MAKDIDIHNADPNYHVQLDLSAKVKSDAQILRRQKLKEAQQKLRDGERLATLFHDKKRAYDKMSQSEQQLWEDFDTGRCLKKMRENQVENMKPFRCSTE